MTLRIDESFKLYKLLYPFLPDTDVEDILEFSSTIIENIEQAGEQEKFLSIALLLTHKKVEELIALDTQEFILLFMREVVENRIDEMIQFYRGFNG